MWGREEIIVEEEKLLLHLLGLLESARLHE